MKNLTNWAVLTFLLLFPFAAQSENLTLPIKSPILTVNEPPPLKVYWKERTSRLQGSRILLDSVCFDYDLSSSEYKSCRKLARNKFKEECKRFTDLYNDSRPYYDEIYEIERDKFCQAAEEFKP